ncbi:MAG: 50S ribosomal protein L11 methyltransferase, partial [Alphaproteobacteria bacterium]
GTIARLRAALGPGVRPVPRGARFDLILANIQLRPLAAMAPAVARRLRPGGSVVLSGLLRADEAEALAAYGAQGLALAARLPLGDWVTLVVTRKAPRGGVICRGRWRA